MLLSSATVILAHGQSGPMDRVAMAKEREAIPGLSTMAIPFPRVVQLLQIPND